MEFLRDVGSESLGKIRGRSQRFLVSIFTAAKHSNDSWIPAIGTCASLPLIPLPEKYVEEARATDDENRVFYRMLVEYISSTAHAELKFREL